MCGINLPADLVTVRKSASRNRGLNLLADLVTGRKVTSRNLLGANLPTDLVTVRKSATRNVSDKSAGRFGDCQIILPAETEG